MKIDNNELKKKKNDNHTCYYFYDIIKFEAFDFDNIFLNKKSYEILILLYEL